MLDVAIDAAKKGGELALRYFKNQPKVSYKPDNSPVTKADIEVEKLIRKIISKKFPDHGIIGEELPPINPKAKYQWIIDPIDGTRNFVRNLPAWSTLVAVIEKQKPVVGICYFPGNDELFSAQKGKGAYLNGKKTVVSKVKNLKNSYICYNSIKHFSDKNKLIALENICHAANTSRNFAELSLSYLFRGKVDAFINAKGNIYDFAAPAILTEEAGGKFTDFEGKFSLTSGNAVATNGLLHDQVLKILNQ